MTRLIVAFACALCLGITSPSNGDLVAHWTGDGTTADATGNGHDGTLVGGATYATGMMGQAFSFSGSNDYMTVAGDMALQSANISVAMWFKANSQSNDQLMLDSSHGGGQAGWALQMLGSSRGGTQANRIDFAYGNGGTFPHVQSLAIVADNNWHHVLATLDGTNMRMYIDGTLENTVAYSGTAAASSNNGGNIRMGKHYNLNRQYSGLMDDVRIYNTAVSSVPEPSSLLLVGLAGLTTCIRRRRNVA